MQVNLKVQKEVKTVEELHQMMVEISNEISDILAIGSREGQHEMLPQDLECALAWAYFCNVLHIMKEEHREPGKFMQIIKHRANAFIKTQVLGGQMKGNQGEVAKNLLENVKAMLKNDPEKTKKLLKSLTGEIKKLVEHNDEEDNDEPPMNFKRRLPE